MTIFVGSVRYGCPAAMSWSENSPQSIDARRRAEPQEVAVRAIPNGQRPWRLQLSVGQIADQRHEGCGAKCEGWLREFLICLPYRGHFVWQLGRDEVVGDANQVLFLPAGDDYRMISPLPDGHAELMIWPDRSVLDDLGVGTRIAAAKLGVRRGSRRASVRLQTARARMLHWAARATAADLLEADELLVTVIASAVDHYEPPDTKCTSSTMQLIRRAKEFIEAELASSIRLKDVGRAVGASPAYLTDVFRRVEGVPLFVYLRQLRLARALVELPHADDLTALALDVGFSSHSHFTAAFRQRFGCTPSEFRQAVRGCPPSLPRQAGEGLSSTEISR
jgi:AraC family transcriptional regulator